jgi:hypothetical protein
MLPFCAALLLFACKKTDRLSTAAPEQTPADETATITRKCAAHEVLEEQIAADPARGERLRQFEEMTQRFVNSGQARLVNGKLVIPVVVNVLYRDPTEDVSDAQIQSQIDVLNEDYNNTNADATNVPDGFKTYQGTAGITFVWEKTLSQHKYASKRSWSTNDDMKRASKGGINPTDPAHYLNLWVVNKMQAYGSTILGYAQFPGGDPVTDGVVIGRNFFGRTGTLLRAPYNLGRTATHEVGHWMNLRHIWGDETGCLRDDEVADTPLQGRENYGCPTFPLKDACTASGNGVMFMNYMDYTDDPCMYMFSKGQADRMNATFYATKAPRATFLSTTP